MLHIKIFRNITEPVTNGARIWAEVCRAEVGDPISVQ
jgi:hypothetical protein